MSIFSTISQYSDVALGTISPRSLLWKHMYAKHADAVEARRSQEHGGRVRPDTSLGHSQE